MQVAAGDERVVKVVLTPAPSLLPTKSQFFRICRALQKWKAWLFSNSRRGATASANLYSLVESAKANGKEPYSYLSWLFEKLPGADTDNVEALVPWNMPNWHRGYFT